MSLPQHNYGYPYRFTADKRKKIEAYLAHKWGVQNDLPDDHPYKYQQASTTVSPIKPDNLALESSPSNPLSFNAGVRPHNISFIDATDSAPSQITSLAAIAPEISISLTADPTVDLEMMWVEPGTFMMGSPTTEVGRSNDEAQHQVTLTKGFYLGKYEVTQAQYEAVMTGNSDGLSATPSKWPNNADRPVEQVSWEATQKFLTRLNAQESGNIPAGWAYVLPTEAQWEYACRAGTTTAYSWGNSITSNDANYGNNIGQTVDVGQYSANPWGFFDMHGNVYEWTADWYNAYSSGAQTDPEGSPTVLHPARVPRGGSWYGTGTNQRSAYRFRIYPHLGWVAGIIGFRVGLQQQ
jgi:formylglycine-generating enzyme required for sulfatase activity